MPERNPEVLELIEQIQNSDEPDKSRLYNSLLKHKDGFYVREITESAWHIRGTENPKGH